MTLSDKFFISDKIEERAVELGDGTSEVLWFKHLDNTMFERYARWNGSNDEVVSSQAGARLLVAGLCEPDGKPAITFKQAVRIKRLVQLRMVNALFEVNGFGAKLVKTELLTGLVEGLAAKLAALIVEGSGATLEQLTEMQAEIDAVMTTQQQDAEKKAEEVGKD